jgi:hypothetical protein
MPKRKNTNFKLPVKLILFLILAAVCAMVILNRFRFFFLRSSYFTITRVAIEGVDPDAFLEFKKMLAPPKTIALPEETKRFLSGLVGKNIFSQDLKAIKKQIEESADIECVVISRRLPGELVFKLRKRIPIAQLKLTRYHLVDQAGMFIAGASDAAYDNLPVILGIEKKNLPGKPQAYYPQAELSLALELIKEKNNAPALIDYRITKVYALNQKASSLFLVENFPDSGLGYWKPNYGTLASGLGYRPAYGGVAGGLLKKNSSLAQIEIKFDLKRPADTVRVLGALLHKLRASLNSQVPPGGQAGSSLLEGIEYIDLRNIDSPVVMEKNKNKQ